MIYRLVWSREVLNYLRDNAGLIDQLELALAQIGKSTTGLPSQGYVDDGISQERYLWTIYGHAILIRKGVDEEQPTLWIEAIKPIGRSSPA